MLPPIWSEFPTSSNLEGAAQRGTFWKLLLPRPINFIYSSKYFCWEVHVHTSINTDIRTDLPLFITRRGNSQRLVFCSSHMESNTSHAFLKSRFSKDSKQCYLHTHTHSSLFAVCWTTLWQKKIAFCPQISMNTWFLKGKTISFPLIF